MSSESKVTSLSDQELSSRTDVILKYSCRSLPNGLHSADRELLAELKRRLNSHKNCSWTYATEEDLLKLPHGLSDEIKSSLSGISKRIKI